MSGGGSLSDVRSQLVIRCQEHPTYRGLSKPKRDCLGCESVRAMRGASVRLLVSFRNHGDPDDYDATVRWGSA